MLSILNNIWDVVTLLDDKQVLTKLEDYADQYVKTNMKTRFFKDIGISKKEIEARYFRKTRSISRDDDLSILWPQQQVELINGWIYFHVFSNKFGVAVEGKPLGFNDIFIETEGVGVAVVNFNKQQKALFFTRFAELFIVER